jgi:hypothetical protein
VAEIYPSLLRLTLPRIGQSAPRAGGLREWLIKGTYATSYDVNSGVVVLQNIAAQDLISYLSFDYERFAFASWESFQSFSLESKNLNFVSWPLLKLYYSAFFAAHAILRATGFSIVNVQRPQTDALNQIISIVNGLSPNLKPGMYQMRLVQVQPGQLQMNISQHVGGSGVHDGFWKSFTEFLEASADDAVANSASDAAMFVAGVSELAPRTRGWLSARRNDINYQQLFGVWYPLTKGKSLNDLIRAVKRSESKSINLDQPLVPPLQPFVATCQYLACLNAEIADYLAARSTASNTFGTRWRKFNSLYDC